MKDDHMTHISEALKATKERIYRAKYGDLAPAMMAFHEAADRAEASGKAAIESLSKLFPAAHDPDCEFCAGTGVYDAPNGPDDSDEVDCPRCVEQWTADDEADFQNEIDADNEA
jgi:hypothetical protein